MTRSWRLAHGRTLALDRPRILAIVNCTPDSFSDGGALASLDTAEQYCLTALIDGAHMLDIGGESTRPGATPVPAEEQIARTVPLIKRLRARNITAPISIDTTSAAVARAAIDAGADAVNDVSAAQDDPEMLPVVARTSAGVILMHRLRTPATDSFSDRYSKSPEYSSAQGGVIGMVSAFLRERVLRALEAGIHRESIVIDPGLGFGKSVEQNFELIRRTRDFCALGYPVLSGASRKSFIGAASGINEPARRVAGSIAVALAHRLAGASLFRVHDVAPHAQALAVTAALDPAQTPHSCRE